MNTINCMKNVIITIFILISIFLYGCSSQVEAPQNAPSLQVQDDTQTDNSEEVEVPEVEDTVEEETQTLKTPDWHNIQLEDVNTGEVYTIGELNDKPILLESFAVWCPKCTQQQREIKKLHEEIGDTVISIGLDIDSNEDKNTILKHIQSNGFDWIYSISPPDLTKELTNEFGLEVVSAPIVPMILICEDGNSYFLDRGFKSVEKLKASINEKCSQNV